MFTLFALVVVALSLASAKVEIPDDLKEYIKDLHDSCLEQVGLTEMDHENYDINDKNPKMMCYMKCLMISSKWMSPGDETIQYDFIIDSVHPAVKPLLMPALNKCRNISKGTQECEKAYNFNICLFHADPENWFLI
ncbi:hypothetical protein MTP99_010520 [Tenebrio molitor]|nr:hypothetical protein MTP99_010520 [Tenebrio molitor]CAH1369033.1 unnamed protein product [Tenebrio molitor]